MSGFYGGDTEQMRGQSSTCTGGAQRLAELISALSSTVEGVQWVGPDAESFRARWRSEAEGRAREAGETLRRLAQELEDHADEQDRASAGDGGGLLDIIADILPAPFPGPPMPLPIPGLPLGPDVTGPLRDALGDWFSGGGASGPQEFYGGPGYGDRGQMYDQGQPLGDWFNYNEDLAPGREIDIDAGHVDVHAGANYSAGMSGSTDPYGNMTGTIGARGSLEAGVDSRLNLPGGFGIDASGNVGIESYAEAGGTVGPDGYSVGARAGSGAYAEQSTAFTHDSGASAGMTQSAWVGADAHATAHSHVTRGADGEVNGITGGFSAGAFAGAEYKQNFEVNGPSGWFSVSGGASATAGAGADASGGYTISTDEVSFSAGGKFAEVIGVGGGGTISVSPNAIVESISPGDYNADDLIDSAQGAWDAGTSAVGDAVSSLNPFD